MGFGRAGTEPVKGEPMRYMVEKSFVRMIGPIWMPASIAAMEKDLSRSDVDNIRGYAEHLHGERKLTREAYHPSV
jgi:hypothetical protein